MVLDLYYLPGSAPCSAVEMTAKALGVKLNLKLLDLFTGEHLKPEFVKVNEKKLGNLFKVYRRSIKRQLFDRLIHNMLFQHWLMTENPCGNRAPFSFTWWKNMAKMIHCIHPIRLNALSLINVNIQVFF